MVNEAFNARIAASTSPLITSCRTWSRGGSAWDIMGMETTQARSKERGWKGGIRYLSGSANFESGTQRRGGIEGIECDEFSGLEALCDLDACVVGDAGIHWLA